MGTEFAESKDMMSVMGSYVNGPQAFGSELLWNFLVIGLAQALLFSSEAEGRTRMKEFHDDLENG